MENDLPTLRAAAGLSQKALGEAVGVSRQAINALERGHHAPSLDLAYRLAAVFGLAVEAVFANPYAARNASAN